MTIDEEISLDAAIEAWAHVRGRRQARRRFETAEYAEMVAAESYRRMLAMAFGGDQDTVD
jgi:rubrerythrin